MNWAQILADTAKYPNDARFTINGVEVTLGQIREQNTATQGELERKLTERQTELDGRARLQDQATDNLAKIVHNVQVATGLSVEDIVAGRIPANMRETVQRTTLNTQTAAGVALADDPLYAPIVRELEPLRGDINLVKTGLGQALGSYREDRARIDAMEWRMNNPNLPADFKVTTRDAVNHAVTKGYKNDVGFPDVTRALEELAAPVRNKMTETELATKYREEGRAEARREMAAQMGQPTFGQPAGMDFAGTPEPSSGGQPAKVSSIKQQLEKAFSDPTMLTSAVQ